MKKIMAVIIVVLLGAVGFFAYKYITAAPDVSNIPLETVLENASDLSTQKIVISNVFESSKGKIFFITKNKYLVKYTTTVKAGFDISEADIAESADKVTITIPHCRIDEESIKIKASDIKLFDSGFTILNANQDQILEVIAEAEKDAKKVAVSKDYGFLEAADANAVNVIKGLFENVANGREVIVEFK